MAKLTQRISDTTTPPATGKELIRDDDLRGFGLSVTKRSKTYFVECRVNGKQRRATVGRADLLTLEEARVKGRKLLAEMTSGFDPHAEKRNEKTNSITLIEVLEEYLAVKQLKKSTVTVYRRVIKKSLKDWLHMPIVAITKNMVEDRHRSLASGTPKGTSGRAYSNFCLKTLQSLLNFAAEKYEVDGKPLIPVNPVSRLTKTRAWFRVHPRTGVIPEYKLADFYKAAMSMENPAVRDYFLLLLFTGVRKCEGTNLRWSDIDFQAKTMTIVVSV
ncbi:hypothetical protein BH10CYA1_BH10CYA1_58420 [soil metagenome]